MLCILTSPSVLGVPSMLSLPTLPEFYQVHYKHLDHRGSHHLLLEVAYLSNVSCNLESSGRVYGYVFEHKLYTDLLGGSSDRASWSMWTALILGAQHPAPSTCFHSAAAAVVSTPEPLNLDWG